MAYIPTQWQNNAVTPVNADNLNHQEAGIVLADSNATNARTRQDTVEAQLAIENAKEVIRIASEVTRVANEVTRVANEPIRVSAETLRNSNETRRETDYNTYKNVMIDASPVANLQNQINGNVAQLANIPQQTYITEKAKQVDLVATNVIVTSNTIAITTNTAKANNPLAQIVPSTIPSSLLKQATDADKIGLANLKQEVRDAMAGTTTIGTTPANGSVTAVQIADGTITAQKIAPGNIVNSLISDNAIQWRNYASRQISGDKIGLNTVLNENIAPNTITTEKLAINAVLGWQIAPNTITYDKIKDYNITNNNLANQVVTQSKIANNAIIGSHIMDGNITGNKIASNTILGSSMVTKTITLDKLANGVISGAKLDTELYSVLPRGKFAMRNINVIGDSISNGAWTINMYEDSWTAIMRKFIQLEYNTKNYGFVNMLGNLGITDNYEFHNAVPVTGSFIKTNGYDSDEAKISLGSSAFIATSSPSTMEITTKKPSKYFRLLYAKGGLYNAIFDVYVNNVLRTTIDCTTGTADNNAISDEILGDENLLFVIKINFKTGTKIMINGVYYYNNLSEVIFNNYGRSGISFRNISDENIAILADCEVLFFALGTNDAGFTLAEFTAKINTLITCVNKVGYNTKVVVLDFLWGGKQPTFRNELYRLASETNGIYIDYAVIFQAISDADMQTMGFLHDVLHPTFLGHQVIAEICGKKLGFGVTSKNLANKLLAL